MKDKEKQTMEDKFKKEMEASQYFMNKNAKSMFDVIDRCEYCKSEENAIRQVKDGAFVDLLNQEQAELKKAMIEEMAKDCCKYCHTMTEEKECPATNGKLCFAERLKEATYYCNIGYRKISEDEVVITKDKYEKLYEKGYLDGKIYSEIFYEKRRKKEIENQVARAIYDKFQKHGTTYVKKWIKKYFEVE